MSTLQKVVTPRIHFSISAPKPVGVSALVLGNATSQPERPLEVCGPGGRDYQAAELILEMEMSHSLTLWPLIPHIPAAIVWFVLLQWWCCAGWGGWGCCEAGGGLHRALRWPYLSQTSGGGRWRGPSMLWVLYCRPQLRSTLIWATAITFNNLYISSARLSAVAVQWSGGFYTKMWAQRQWQSLLNTTLSQTAKNTLSNLTQSNPNTKTCTNTLSQPANKLYPLCRHTNSGYHVLRNTHIKSDNKQKLETSQSCRCVNTDWC